jgi:hypothetical protein
VGKSFDGRRDAYPTRKCSVAVFWRGYWGFDKFGGEDLDGAEEAGGEQGVGGFEKFLH